MKWSRENYYHNLSSPYCLRLASGDASGKIIVWDVVSGTAHCEIQEHSKPIQGEDVKEPVQEALTLFSRENLSSGISEIKLLLCW